MTRALIGTIIDKGLLCSWYPFKVNKNSLNKIKKHYLTIYYSTDSTSNSNDNKSFSSVLQTGQLSQIRMPNLALEDKKLVEETIMKKWHKRTGEKIKTGDILCEVETPDLLLDLEAEKDGYLAEKVIREGDAGIEAGKTLGIIAMNKDILSDYQNTNKITNTEADKKNDIQTSHENIEIMKKIKYLTDQNLLAVDEVELQTIMSLARNNDERLHVIYKSSFNNDDNNSKDNNNRKQFDEKFFIDNILGLAKDIISKNK